MGKGKITRISLEIREQLNRRIQEGGEGEPLVAWLNSLPEVRAIVDMEFGGKPVSEQNLSEWRKRGYREWLVQQEAKEALRCINEETKALRDEPTGDLTESVVLWLTSRYLVAAQKLNDNDDGLDWNMMREYCKDLVALRRGDHSAARLKIEREKLNLEANTKLKFGLKELSKEISANPKAMEAYKQMTQALGDD